MDIDAKNVVIFMSDSIRYDSHPKEIESQGLTFRTIASSLHTPTSIASMLSGEYLFNHNIRGFTDVFQENTQTILDCFPNQGLSNVGGSFNDPMQGQFFNDTIYNHLLRRYEMISLSEMEEPFGWFMRDPGGHTPYAGWDEELNVNQSVPEFYDEYAGDEEEMERLYEKGIDDSVERFKRYVIEPLRERGILEDTLVVFLSDHGELLGEYGHVGQSYPACPEIVYVPMTFIHPDLPTEVSDDLARGIDLPDSIASLLDIDPPESTDGVSAPDGESPEQGYSLYNRSFPSFVGDFNYEIRSIWDEDGGHVFNTSSLWSKLKLTAGYTTKIAAGKHLRRSRNPLGFKLLLENERTWGTPQISRDEAWDELETLEGTSQSAGGKIDEAARENLEDLGYL